MQTQNNNNRYNSGPGEKNSPPGNEKTFNLLVDKVPYSVKTSAFTFNGETRFYVSINGGDDHVFTWDSEIKGLRAIDNDSFEIPDAVEKSISQKLQSLK